MRAQRIALLFVLLAPHPSISQTSVPRIEVGVQALAVRMNEDVLTNTVRGADGFYLPVLGASRNSLRWGPAPTISIRLNRNFAFDATYALLPRVQQLNNTRSNFHSLMVGMKAQIDSPRTSMFAKVRPGFVRWSESKNTPVRATEDSGVVTFGGMPSLTRPAIDLGGGMEFSLSRNLVIRAELSDLVYSGLDLDGRNHLQFSTGAMYRMGPVLKIEGMPEQGAHRFLDRTNIMLFSANLLAQSADAITTQRFFQDCRRAGYIQNCVQWETDPLARPFVQHGWGGQLALAALVNTVQTGIVLRVHKMGHHKIERFLTIPLTVGSAICAYKNLQRR